MTIFNEPKLGLGGIALILAGNASTRNGKIIRCKLCNLELGQENIEYVLEGTDQEALIAGPCLISGGFYTIQKIPKNQVPSYVSADKRIALKVEVENFNNNALKIEEFEQLVANARGTGTLLQIPVQRVATPDGIKTVSEIASLTSSKSYREILLTKERVANYSGVLASIVLVAYSFAPGTAIPLLGKVLGAAMMVASLGTLLIELRYR